MSARVVGHTRRREAGQVVLFFALLLPVLLGIGAIVGGIGNWYVHGKNLQTKADAGAFAGGGRWAFPCGPQIDTRIADTARLYAGSNNPQVGKVPDANVKTRLNALRWYDDDSNPGQLDFDNPTGSVCSAMRLDVKVTEDNSFPLLSLMPLFPDIKRKAVVQIEEAEGLTGLLPIAIRAPEPVSAAAVYYNEETNRVLGVKYLVKADGIIAPTIPGIPGGLQGWTQNNPEDPATGSGSNPYGFWSRFAPGAKTGVLLAVSFRGACNDASLPPSNTKITTTAAPCFQDEYVGQPVSSLCNQGGSTQIVNCFWSTGNWPSEVQQAGLQFIHGYGVNNPGAGPPLVESVYLDGPSANCGAYYAPLQPSTCTAVLHASINIGSFDPDGPGPLQDTRSAADTEVRYRIVSDSGTYCAFNTPTCDLLGSGGPGSTSWTTTNDLPTFDSGSLRNSIVIRVRLRNTSVGGNPCGGTYSSGCQWFYKAGSGALGVAPTDAEVLPDPLQRSFRGNTVSAGSTRWLRLTTDDDCDPFTGNVQDGQAASVLAGGQHCFYMDFGLKGGLALNSSDPMVLFNDGVGPSQMGAVDCDPAIPQGQMLEDGILNGCQPWYAKHPFDYNPLCPQQNNLFTTPNPGAPWDDGRWPPIRCIKTRPTGSMNQIEQGFKLRFFGDKNANSCPTTPVGANGYVKGRNYWDIDNNIPALGGGTYGYKEGAHDTLFPDGDPRIVTIFIAPTEAFAATGQNTYPIAGFVEVYVTGFGRMKSNNPDDPCPGNTAPAEIDDCQGSSCGYAVWGHLINYAVPSPQATPSGIVCNPGASLQPCVATLVE
jgi:Putative Flp pilus-assembly TadE/G-like